MTKALDWCVTLAFAALPVAVGLVAVVLDLHPLTMMLAVGLVPGIAVFVVTLLLHPRGLP